MGKKQPPGRTPYEGTANGPFHGHAGAGAAGFPMGKGGPTSAIFLPKIKNLLQFQHAGHSQLFFWCPKVVLEASQRDFEPKMPRFVAADVSFDRFVGCFCSGS